MRTREMKKKEKQPTPLLESMRLFQEKEAEGFLSYGLSLTMVNTQG